MGVAEQFELQVTMAIQSMMYFEVDVLGMVMSPWMLVVFVP